MSTNRIQMLELWLAAAWMGAVTVLVSAELKGAQLAHVLEDSGSRLLIVEEELARVLRSVDRPLPALQNVHVLEELPSPPETRAPAFAGRPGDTTMILYTSGTSGPPKGVLRPHGQVLRAAQTTSGLLGVGEADALYTCLPLFHINALNAFMQALASGATLVVGPKFSASAFWQRLADSEATVTYLLGVMARILAERPPGRFDRAHRARVALAPGTPAALHAVFRDRFRLELVDAWASTETNVIIATAGLPAPPGSMGALLDGYEARVVDEDDLEVPADTPGELIVRAAEPHSFSSGYLNLPEVTLRSWRNLWFHTGDLVRRDADGWFWFEGRRGDAIRHRGENISADEVEAALLSHPDVETAAVVGVPSPLGEHDVMAFVVLHEVAAPDPAALVAHCRERLAGFAVPRFVEIVDELPLNASGKVERFRLRERGVTGNTWDREQTEV
jgi:crotonobetaine/carnitine-CoA ligase